ncbi:MAG: hypothetical protein V3V08_08800 [Nannocystaceae bacterium]
MGGTSEEGRLLSVFVPRAWPEAEIFRVGRSGWRPLSDCKFGARDPGETDVLGRPPPGDLAFVFGGEGADRSVDQVDQLVGLGYRVVAVGGLGRRGDPIAASGINDVRVCAGSRVVVSPTVTSIAVATVVAPLARRWVLESATVSSYQAVSMGGAPSARRATDRGRSSDSGDTQGRAGPPEARSSEWERVDATGFSAIERRVAVEVRKLLKLPALAFSVQCWRVPAGAGLDELGSFENVWFTLGQPANIGDISAVLKDATAAPYVHHVAPERGDGGTVWPCRQRPGRVCVGGVRRDLRDDSGRSFCLRLGTNNMHMGTVANAVRLASLWFPTRVGDL